MSGINNNNRVSRSSTTERADNNNNPTEAAQILQNATSSRDNDNLGPLPPPSPLTRQTAVRYPENNSTNTPD